jgi:hypothetical protein
MTDQDKKGLTNAEKLDATRYLYETLCKLKAKPTVAIFKRYFACNEQEAVKLLYYAINQSMNPRRWACRNADVDHAGKMSVDESEMYFCAFRYCLGRMTYVVSDFCEEATRKIAQIRTKCLYLMDKEITEAEQWDKKNPCAHGGRLGMDCDRSEWLKFREVVRKELEKRGEK